MSNLFYFPTGRQEEALELPYLTKAEIIRWTSDSCGMVVEIDYAWEVLTGQTKYDSRSWGWLEVVEPEDRERIARMWCRTIASGGKYATVCQINARGHIVEVATCAAPVLNEKGRVQGWEGIACVGSTQLDYALKALQQAV